MTCPEWLWKILLEFYSPPELQDRRVSVGLAELVKQFPHLPVSEEAPVFIFSAGWRSGSTLLQRLLNTHPDVMIWGEAYENTFLLHHLAAPFAGFTKEPLDFLFRCDHISNSTGPDELTQSLTQAWIANLSPDPADLKLANLAFMETLFKSYPRENNRSRWGIKLVSGTEILAGYLRWLYPNCKLLYLVRNPSASFSSYRSCTKDGTEPWYLHFPNYPVKHVVSFVTHWRRCAEGFLNSYRELDAFLLRYEALIDGSMLEPLQQYLDLRLDASVLASHVDFPSSWRAKKEVTRFEQHVIRFIGGDVAKKLGYLL
jgi:hypothetical protein